MPKNSSILILQHYYLVYAVEIPSVVVLHPWHTCDIFFEPDREIWDFSEGDWGWV